MAEKTYNNDLKVKDALQLYFSKYHFKDGGYNLKWFRIKLGPLYIPMPNIKTRVEAVRIHDIHHLVTEYNADWKGEVEIGAWEIASGCERYSIAWLLNLGSFFVGMIIYPRSLFRAFIRGRRCATNLYYKTQYDHVLLNKTLGELRNKIEIESPKRITYKDYIAFVLWCLIALCYHVAIIAVFLYSLYKLATLLF